MKNDLQYEFDMLEGNINRLAITDDADELRRMYHWALKRLKEIRLQRLVDMKVIVEECDNCGLPKLRRKYDDNWFCPDCDHVSL